MFDTISNNDIEIQEEQLVDLKAVLEPKFDLIIYNDDVNTFEFVIESLVDICNHNPIQAEQCTWIIHHNGKCSVKHDVLEELEPMCEAFLERKISAKIEG